MSSREHRPRVGAGTRWRDRGAPDVADASVDVLCTHKRLGTSAYLRVTIVGSGGEPEKGVSRIRLSPVDAGRCRFWGV